MVPVWKDVLSQTKFSLANQVVFHYSGLSKQVFLCSVVSYSIYQQFKYLFYTNLVLQLVKLYFTDTNYKARWTIR